VTPTELRMWRLLRGGEGVSPEALHGCLYDDRGPLRNIRAHLSSLRRKLAPRGQHILCERAGGAVRYRLVCAVTSKTTRLNPV
jgi:hypothetical protein